MRKYKYYFHKPRGEIAKYILQSLVVGGALLLSGASVASMFWSVVKNRQRYQKKRFCDTFTRLVRKGLIVVERHGHDLKITLTQEGKRAAGYMQIDKLKINRPKQWDGFWRFILFDISNLRTPQRNAFRGMLKELEFIPFQKSVWVHAFDCTAEIELLADFFGIQKEVRLILTKDIGNDDFFRKHFHI